MATTENTFTGNGSTTSYSFTFQYLDEDDIKVSINGTNTTAYSLSNATTVLFNTAPANGALIRIYRDTDVDSLKSTFFAGSSIRAQDLNNNFLQNNYAVQEIENNNWDKETQTIHSDEAWSSVDTQIATTAAMDARFVDQVSAETIAGVKTFSSSPIVPTTPSGATAATNKTYVDTEINDKINTAITSDIGTDGTGITVTNDGDGTITLGLGANSIDFDRIKDVDIITQAEQNAGSPAAADTNLFTALAAARRFDTLVQTGTPTGSNWEVGKTWLQNDTNLTLSVWNGSAWLGLASGGTFTNQPKVVYVDATAGSDTNDGHRISRPKATIKAAIQQINNDATYGDGSIVVVAPGVYQEVAPIDIQKSNVSIIGTALRSCIVHPTPATETNVLFRVNSGSYLQNLTFTGMKASGALGNTVDAALPVNQGWNVAFYPGATITKSPYIQNCTNFSDSEIDNSNLNVITPAGGAAGDTDSAPTGGGLLVDGSVVNSASPLRSMVCDSYTHVGLNGPGILVTNNGYAQCTSSYAFFNKYHIKCLNGGQANLAASTTDFGDQALVADGKSTSAIFTAALSTSANSGDITFTINAPTAGASWHGSATRPQGNMLVVLNGITYPILSATANGSGWNVTISRPNPTNRSENLGLNGAVSTPATASFYLRSMIASSGHTMEYVGSGTNYLALPENGGVPDNTKQIVELNNGKVWTAITDQNGKFKVGDFFEVDQQLGFVTIPSGSIAFDLASDLSPQLGANLDVLSRTISSSTGNVRIDDTLEVNAGTAAAPAVTFNGDTNTGIYSPGADQVAISTAGSGRLFVDSVGNIGANVSPFAYAANARNLQINATGYSALTFGTTDGGTGEKYWRWIARTASPVKSLILQTLDDAGGGEVNAYTIIRSGTAIDYQAWNTGGSERLRITSDGKVGIGTASPAVALDVSGGNILGKEILLQNAAASSPGLGTTPSWYSPASGTAALSTNASERLRIDSSGRVGIGTSAPGDTLHVVGNIRGSVVRSESSEFQFNGGNSALKLVTLNSQNVVKVNPAGYWGVQLVGANDQGILIDNSGRVGIGTTPDSRLHVSDGSGNALRIGYNPGSNNFNIHDAAQHLFRNNGGASEYGRFDSSGRLLVGTSSAFDSANTGTSWLVGVENPSNYTALSLKTNQASANGAYINLGKSRGNSSNSKALVNNNDELGGIYFEGADGAAMRIGANISAFVDAAPGAGDMPTRLVFSTTADGASSPTERMRINNDGGIVGGGNTSTYNLTTNPGFSFSPGSTAGSFNGLSLNKSASNWGTALFIHRTSGVGQGAFVEFAYSGTTIGNISNNGASNVAYNTSSDYRLKENIKPLAEAIKKLLQLKPSTFNFIIEPDRIYDGFIAHELQEVVPGAVTGEKDAVNEDGSIKAQGVDQSKLVPLLTAALQEAVAKIESLEARLTAAGI